MANVNTGGLPRMPSILALPLAPMPCSPSQVTPQDRLGELLAPQAEPKGGQTRRWLQNKTAQVAAGKGEGQAQRSPGRQGGGGTSSSDEGRSAEGGEHDEVMARGREEGKRFGPREWVQRCTPPHMA